MFAVGGKLLAAVNSRMEVNTFTIHSVGDEILEVDGIWIESGVGAFVIADTTSYSLAPQFIVQPNSLLKRLAKAFAKNLMAKFAQPIYPQGQ